MSKLSNEIIEQIPVLYNELKNKSEVARRLNISTHSVNKYLTIANASPIIEKQKGQEEQEEQKKQKIKITDEIITKINEEYAKNRSLTQTGKIFGVSTSTVKKYLSKDNLLLKKQENDDKDALWYYIYRLFGLESEEQPVSNWNIIQMMRFREQGMPYRGQLLTLKYFYEVKHNPVKKSNKSIGIIPWVWNESKMYYEKQAQHQKEIGEIIQKQLEKDRMEIKYKPRYYVGARKKHKKQIDLNTI